MTIEDLITVLSSRSLFSIRALSGDSKLFRGHGIVKVSKPDRRTVIFDEHGVWTSPARLEVAFRNVYRWSLHCEARTCGLDHLRHGWNRSVHLVDFVAVAPDAWQCTAPHSCGSDIYSARMHNSDRGLELSWRIQGPSKDQEIECLYAP